MPKDPIITEDELAAAGTSDPNKDGDKQDDVTSVAKQLASTLADEFKQNLAKASEAQPAAPAQSAPVEDAAQKQAAAVQAYNDEIAAIRQRLKDGEIDQIEANELHVQAISKAQAHARPDPQQDPTYQATRGQSRHLAQQEHKAVFDQYSSEIEAEVSKMAPAKGMSLDGYHEAISIVRGRHHEEILKAEREEWENKRAASMAPHVAGGRGGAASSSTGKQVELTPEEAGIARSFDMTHEQYAAARERGEKSIAEGGTRLRNGMHQLVSDKVEVGRF